ncbi:predicted protein [Naegleria gruberi]|uniref:Predicted protein n=1 Tax=Naegleria gruberi TaxID=5762 RepID=D2UXR1_NAEGR|nr:uncharacterized protein NAEGRDRAFT_61212 [Naegleria gruberi]EFC50333.1 predicted protein [Naegleria gruberi]|eukprot:XP_002683077.1 predicted protein [Naegleria gruberi strain NEG-M]
MPLIKKKTLQSAADKKDENVKHKSNSKMIPKIHDSDDEVPEMSQSTKAKLAVAELAKQELKKESAKNKKIQKIAKKSNKRKVEEVDEQSDNKKQKKLLDVSVLDFLVEEDNKKNEPIQNEKPQIQATLETAAPTKSRSKRFVELGLEARIAKEKVDPFTVKTEVDPSVLQFLHLEFYKKNHRKDTAKFLDAKRSTIVPASDFFGEQKWPIDQVFLNPYDF